ncbi:MAG: 4-hydroxythreonine-4-phosphate dehydrogenase PdxA, partial [Tidjanibacter sp.]|nr:4-hydroxythreonine-4-phosphate dehydrogenase PdxA [Tidjanibacter sp.]
LDDWHIVAVVALRRALPPRCGCRHRQYRKAPAPPRQAVNYTAGLDLVRTSPDHGTGYDIAGADKADAQSMRNAIYMAVDVYRNRQRYAEMSCNPLRHYERDKGRDISVSDLPEVEESL